MSDHFNDRFPYSITASELAERGSRRIPEELTSSGHLIYSSPATLAFNSPGAEGFGVKRAGLSIPGSVMLIVSPGCCGRNTSAISSLPGYRNRFFYLQMRETDLVSAGHLDRISGAVGNIIEALGHKPSVVMICITCVDALLATDMERVCRRAEEENGVKVRPCYMYALTREGRRPPMVYVRQSLYSLLEKRPRRATACNLIGYFAPVDERSELYRILKQAGIRTIRQISACPTYEEFEKMSEANFNLMLDPGARAAADDMEVKLGIPSIEIRRLYQPDKIRNQYAALGNVLGTAFDTKAELDAAMEKVQAFKTHYPEAVFAVGECLNADPLELSLSLLRFGFQVREIYATVTQDTFIYIKKIAELSPETRIFSNLHPSMAFYKEFYKEKEKGISENGSPEKSMRNSEGSINITVGKDAGYYHPDLPNVPWNSDVQPYGFQALGDLFAALYDVMEGKKDEEGRYRAAISLSPAEALRKRGTMGGTGAPDERNISERAGSEKAVSESMFRRGVRNEEPANAEIPPGKNAIPLQEYVTGRREISELKLKKVDGVKGFSQHLTPFAPDQSGAVSVLYNMGGLIVVCDAGGCTGNICGFDEPRWFTSNGRVFSAGLRDMDAIMGEDENLVEKTAAAADLLHPSFCAFIGTPVPAVIATDFKALRRMCEKKTGLPVLSLDTTGMEYYDIGEEKAYLALFRTFTRDSLPDNKGKDRCAGEKKIGVLGCTPMDTLTDTDVRMMEKELCKDGWDEIAIYGENAKAGEREDTDAGLEAVRKAADNNLNLVIAPAGLKAARYLQRTFGTPYRIGYPGIGRWVADFLLRRCRGQDIRGRKILIVHQQVLAETLARYLMDEGTDRVQTATFFKSDTEISALNSGLGHKCLHFESEQDFRREALDGPYDLILADLALKELIPEYGGDYIDLPHFALSGRKLL